MMTDSAPTDRVLLLLRGGTPEAERFAAMLDDPEYREHVVEAFQAAAQAVSSVMEQMGRAFIEAAASIGAMLDTLREAGVLADLPPTDPRQRALWMTHHRGTGPARPGPERSHAPRAL